MAVPFAKKFCSICLFLYNKSFVFWEQQQLLFDNKNSFWTFTPFPCSQHNSNFLCLWCPWILWIPYKSCQFVENKLNDLWHIFSFPFAFAGYLWTDINTWLTVWTSVVCLRFSSVSWHVSTFICHKMLRKIIFVPNIKRLTSIAQRTQTKRT